MFYKTVRSVGRKRKWHHYVAEYGGSLSRLHTGGCVFEGDSWGRLIQSDSKTFVNRQAVLKNIVITLNVVSSCSLTMLAS